MTKATKNSSSIKWSDIKNTLNEINKDELINLVKDLYNKSNDNKMFIIARFNTENKLESFEEYRERLIKAFSPDHFRPKLSIAKKLINDYKKATGDLKGTLSLMIIYAEQAIRFSDANDYCEESLENSVYIVMEELKKILMNDKSENYLEIFRDDLLKLHELADKAEDFMFEEAIVSVLEDLKIIESDDEYKN